MEGEEAENDDDDKDNSSSSLCRYHHHHHHHHHHHSLASTRTEATTTMLAGTQYCGSINLNKVNFCRKASEYGNFVFRRLGTRLSMDRVPNTD
ncbi:hypothetical protein M0804_014124 [Polistes exclamans]|nr:hypothetical protein M0804_014126 [Polistes exclamans]KAI4475729.1 hypothetical protein M0804_014124 [Polistes exclamans]